MDFQGQRSPSNLARQPQAISKKISLQSNTLGKTFPSGFHVEVLKFFVLFYGIKKKNLTDTC